MNERIKGIIYLDGADGQGKTTLANHLAKEYRGHVIHLTYRWKNYRNGILAYHIAALNRAVKLSQQQLVIIDRHWLTEEIYAKVYRGGTTWPHYGRMIDRVLLKHAAITVICQSEPEFGAARHAFLAASRDEMYKPDEKMLAINKEFWWAYYGTFTQRDRTPEYPTYLSLLADKHTDDFEDGYGLSLRSDFFHYSIEKHGQDLVGAACSLIHQLQLRREAQYQPALLARNRNILGFLPTAKYLFVGDCLNPKTRAIRWPFFDYGDSSLYLSKALHTIGLDEQHAMYTNAFRADDTHVTALLAAKPELRVVALGGNAAEFLNDLGVDFYRVDHPQHARRFDTHGKYPERLAKALALS